VKLAWTRPAHADRKKIREYIAQHAPAAALALDELFQKKLTCCSNIPAWVGLAGCLAPAS
jgi:plasmid stabilization system protein ParE